MSLAAMGPVISTTKGKYQKKLLINGKKQRYTGMDVIWNINGANVLPEDKFDNDLNDVFAKIVNMIREAFNKKKRKKG